MTSAPSAPICLPACGLPSGVLHAVNAWTALSFHPDHSVQHAADEWLQLFTRAKDSWTVCDSILRLYNNPPFLEQCVQRAQQILSAGGATAADSQSTEVKEDIFYFAAQTLRQKVQLSFSDLPNAESRLQFRNALLDHCWRFRASPNTVKIKTRLALTLAALVVHLVGCGEWSGKGALEELCEGFGKSAESGWMLLEILTFVPEEASDERLVIRVEHRTKAVEYLNSFSKNIPGILTAYLGAVADNRQLQAKVFDCLYSWIRYSGMSLLDLVQHDLFRYAFDAIRMVDLQSISCDVICEFLKQAQRRPLSAHSDGNGSMNGSGNNGSMNGVSEIASRSSLMHHVITFVIPNVLEFAPLWKESVQQDNISLSKRLCFIYTEVGLSYLDWLVEGSDSAKQIMEMILKCVAHPNPLVSYLTFGFWYRLSRHISDTADEQQKSHKTNLFGNYFLQAAESIRLVMKFPVDYESMDADEQNEVKEYRYNAADALRDCTNVVGSTIVLKQILSVLRTEYERYVEAPDRDWQGFESCLHAIRCVARNVETDENELLPNIMQFLPSLCGLTIKKPNGANTNLPQNHHIRYTATLIIGRYTDWIKKHPQFLASLLSFVVGGLQDRYTVSAASFAFKHVCQGCADVLAQKYVNDLFSVYSTSRALHPTNQKEVIEGMCYVVAKLPAQHLVAALDQLLMPLEMQLTPVVEGAKDQQQQVDARRDEQLSSVLDRIAEVFRSFDLALVDQENEESRQLIMNAVAEKLKKLWTALINCLEQFQSDDVKMERLCRCFRYGMKASGRMFGPLLESFAQRTTSAFLARSHGCFLYAMLTAADLYANIPETRQLFAGVLDHVADRVVKVFATADAMTGDPYLVEEFFRLLEKFIQRSPDLVYNSRHLSALLQTVALGVQVQHREALCATMDFLYLLLREALPFGTRSKGSPHSQQQTQTVFLSKLVEPLMQSGPRVLLNLLDGISGGLPEVRVTHLLPALMAFIDLIGDQAAPWLKAAIEQLKIEPPVQPTHEEFVRILVSGTDTQFNFMVFAWSKACRAKMH